jgi:hypothetical protein
MALNQLKNPYLHQMLRNSLDVPSYKTVRYQLLPDIYSLLKKRLEQKLSAAKSVALMVDIWTNRIMVPYIGVAASLGYDLAKKEMLVIGFDKMPPGAHNSESLKLAIETIVNRFAFEKSKIAGI